MKRKILIIVGIVFIILIIAGLITSYVDAERVENSLEPKYVIKSISEEGNKVTYWGLGYKVIRYPGVSPNEPYNNNIGVKYGSWFMEYELEEVENKTNEQNNETYEKRIENITLKLDIPKDWKYEELSRNVENDFYKYALKIYKNSEDRYAVLYYYQEMFGVCGTGRTSDQINLNNGNKATIGYYDGKNTWEDISFSGTNSYIAILNYGLNNEESNEFIKFIKTMNIEKNK